MAQAWGWEWVCVGLWLVDRLGHSLVSSRLSQGGGLNQGLNFPSSVAFVPPKHPWECDPTQPIPLYSPLYPNLPLSWASGYAHSDLCSCPTCDPSLSKLHPFPLGYFASQINLNQPFSSLSLYTYYPNHTISLILYAAPFFNSIAQNTSVTQLDQSVCVCAHIHKQVCALFPLGCKHPTSPDLTLETLPGS